MTECAVSAPVGANPRAPITGSRTRTTRRRSMRTGPQRVRRLVRLGRPLPACGCVRSCFLCGLVAGLPRRITGCRDPTFAQSVRLRLLFFFDRGRRTSVLVFSVLRYLVDGGILGVPRVGVPAPTDPLHPRDQMSAAGHDVRPPDRRRSRNESTCPLLASAVAAAVSSSSSRTESPSSPISGDEARNSDPCTSRSSGPLGDRPPAPAIFTAILNWCVRPSRYPAPTAAATSTLVLVFPIFIIEPTCCVSSPRTASGVGSMWNMARRCARGVYRDYPVCPVPNRTWRALRCAARA